MVASTPAPADRGTPDPPCDFAPSSLCSLSTIPYCKGGRKAAEVSWIWGSIYHQTCTDGISKHGSTTGEDLQSGRAGSECPLPTRTHIWGKLFPLLVGSSGLKRPVFAPWQLCDGNQCTAGGAGQEICYESTPLS